jgi:hypothetical protein
MTNQTPATDSPNSRREGLNEIQRERERLQQEITQLRIERDQLAKALVSLLREEVTLREEEILAQLGHEKPLREFLQECAAVSLGIDRMAAP